ncbi:MAG: hypothetical protein Q8Q65_01490 [bacterium]|nr:hypothetical protein [bacterium]
MGIAGFSSAAVRKAFFARHKPLVKSLKPWMQSRFHQRTLEAAMYRPLRYVPNEKGVRHLTGLKTGLNKLIKNEFAPSRRLKAGGPSSRGLAQKVRRVR